MEQLIGFGTTALLIALVFVVTKSFENRRSRQMAAFALCPPTRL